MNVTDASMQFRYPRADQTGQRRSRCFQFRIRPLWFPPIPRLRKPNAWFIETDRNFSGNCLVQETPKGFSRMGLVFCGGYPVVPIAKALRRRKLSAGASQCPLWVSSGHRQANQRHQFMAAPTGGAWRWTARTAQFCVGETLRPQRVRKRHIPFSGTSRPSSGCAHTSWSRRAHCRR
jgi:hypothetical protein